MARQPLTPSQKRYRRQGWIIQLIALVIFIAGVFAMKPLLDRPARTDDLLALIGGFLMLQVTVLMIVALTIGPRDPEASRQQPLTTVLTSASAAVALLLPIIGEDLIDPRLNFAIVLVVTVASVWLLWRMWRAGDELSRTYMKEAYAANYLVLVYALLVYAVGERLGLFGGVTAWGGLAVATLASFPVSIWVAMRRGMTQPPKDEGERRRRNKATPAGPVGRTSGRPRVGRLPQGRGKASVSGSANHSELLQPGPICCSDHLLNARI